MPKQSFAVGDKVSCKVPVEAYYSNYGGNPIMVFRPGMVGTIASIAPKVRNTPKRLRDKAHDSKADMLVIDYDCPITGQLQRASLNYCNTVKG
jgi:hypothetical protein